MCVCVCVRASAKTGYIFGAVDSRACNALFVRRVSSSLSLSLSLSLVTRFLRGELFARAVLKATVRSPTGQMLAQFNRRNGPW